MRRYYPYLILAVIALLWYFHEPAREIVPEDYRAPETPREPPLKPNPKPQPAAKPAPKPVPPTQMPPAIKQAPKLVQAQPREAGSKKRKAPAGTVPFDLVGDYVVAFGDVLLGRPTTPNFPKSGFIEKPGLQLWNSHEIPYSIHSTLPNHDRVLRVIQYFHSYTPVRFVPYKGQADSIVFMPGEELCLSYLGRIGGNQPIYCSDPCSDREITHEIMHALGFIHEHSRNDRDRFVKINWDNIETGREDQFLEAPPELNEPLKGRPFDYKSTMLYFPQFFAREQGAVTIESLGPPIAPVMQGLSEEDIARVYLLYGR